MLTCVPCHFNKGKLNVPATYNVWPALKNEDGSDYDGWLPYTYMCTQCVIDALQNGMDMPNVALPHWPPGPVVGVQQITRIKQQPEQEPLPASNVIKVDFEKGDSLEER